MSKRIQVTMNEAMSQLSLLAKRVWAGDRVVITKDGKPYLDLLPHVDVDHNERKNLRDRRSLSSDSFFVHSLHTWSWIIRCAQRPCFVVRIRTGTRVANGSVVRN
jgi:antitoxin (DNA-binding transcriptional repressor) of toxin-antitoxin stability system